MLTIDELIKASPVVLLTGNNREHRTKLALHAARRLAGLFPDGVLYADLRREDPHAFASRFLAALAKKQVLVVLDDVAAEVQVRAFLPQGDQHSRVLMTSANWLGALPGIRRFSARSPLRAPVQPPR